MVDVIVVSYNHSQFLRTCLDSIAQQTYKDFHLTIIDDCSPDNSAAIIEAWANENAHLSITLQLNKKNLGLCENLNIVLKNTQSPFVKLLAADDYLAPTYLEKAVETLQNLPEEYAILHTKAQYVDEHNQPIPEKTFFQRNHKTGDIEREMFQENFICAPTVLLKRQLYDTVGFYSPDIILEDYELWLKAASKGFKFAFLDETLVFYRYHNDNITKKKQQIIHMESVLLRIKYDTNGKNRKAVNRSLLALYKLYGKSISPAILAQYATYSGKNPLLLKLIKMNFPYWGIKIIEKIQGK